MSDDNNADTIIAIYNISKQTQLAVDQLADVVLTRDDAFNLIKVDQQQAETLEEHSRQLSILSILNFVPEQFKWWRIIAGLTVIALALLALVVYVG
jgi:hypothetical protein